MDEPASALDPIATAKIEDLMDELAAEYTVVIVTHNVQQTARISERIAVFLTIFENPESDRRELDHRHVRVHCAGDTRPCYLAIARQLSAHSLSTSAHV